MWKRLQFWCELALAGVLATLGMLVLAVMVGMIFIWDVAVMSWEAMRRA